MSTHCWLTCVICMHWLMTSSCYVPLFCTVSWIGLSDIIWIIKGEGPALNPLKTINISALSWKRVSVVTFRSTVDDFHSTVTFFFFFLSLYCVYICKSLAHVTVEGPVTTPPIGHVPWLLGHGSLPLADWLARMTITQWAWGSRRPGPPLHLAILIPRPEGIAGAAASSQCSRISNPTTDVGTANYGIPTGEQVTWHWF